MRKDIVYFVSIILLGFILTGCSNTYQIEHNYDDTNKILKLSPIVIKDVQEVNDKYYTTKGLLDKASRSSIRIGAPSPFMGDFQYIFKHYNTNNGLINFITITAPNRGVITDSYIDYLNKNFYTCSVEKIANINFIQCKGNKYFIDIPDSNKPPYKTVYVYELPKLLFTQLNTYFQQRANQDNIEIKKSYDLSTFSVLKKNIDEYGFDKNEIHVKTNTKFHPCGMTKKDILSSINDCKTINGKLTYNYEKDSLACLVGNDEIILAELILEQYRKNKNDNLDIEEKEIYVEILQDETIYAYGKPIFTVHKGDKLLVEESKTCRSGDGICWKVKDLKTGQNGYVQSNKMYDIHKVHKK